VTLAHCTHSSDALCLACNPAHHDAYLSRHGKNREYPHPDRHGYIADDSGLTCVRCELPSGNRIHAIGGGF
jgi:hypothetical protein